MATNGPIRHDRNRAQIVRTVVVPRPCYPCLCFGTTNSIASREQFTAVPITAGSDSYSNYENNCAADLTPPVVKDSRSFANCAKQYERTTVRRTLASGPN